MSLFRDLFWFFKQERKSYGTGIFVLVVVALLNLIPPYLVRITVDRIENKSLTPGTVLMLIAQLIAVGLLVYALRYAWRILIFGSAVRLGKLMRSRLYTQFTLMSPGFFHTHNTGDLMAHATNDVQAIEMTAGEGVLTFADSLITGSLVVISMALFISWKLTIIALLPMPLMAWLTSYYGTLLHRYFHQAQAAFSQLNDKVQENIAGVRVIKAFGQEEAERSAFRELSAEVVAKNVAVAKVDALFDPTIMLIVGISFFLSVAFGSIDVIRGRLSLGQLTQFTIYLGQFIWPMLAFGWLFNIIERGRASYDRVSALLAVQPEIREREDALQQIPSGSVEVNLKCFCFPGSTISALQDISFSLRCGQTLGIVGRTGSGKTILLRLLLREFDLKSGDILIGDRSIYAYKLSALRAAIGYVPQDHFLFSTSIAENIAFAKPQANLAEIRAAAELACIHADILQFADQYATVVGDRGITLSGGQKQRISIARALLINPEILILDDALSAVDAKTEKMILHSLTQNRRGRTTLIASHRLSAVEHADLIIVLDEGRIIEQGTHAQLMAVNGWYASTYRSQQLESSLSAEEAGNDY